jgi:glycosyltransferase involved in cell wall biosynthesis
MPSVLVVSESNVGFHQKLTVRTKKSLENAGYTVVGNCLKPQFTPEAWKECFEKAILYDVDRIHIDRLIRPEDFWRALQTYKRSLPPISFLLGGVSEQLRRYDARLALDCLEMSSRVDKIFIMSIHHRSLQDFCKRISFLQDPKVVYMDQPLYEEKGKWRKIEKGVARLAMNVPKNAKVCLYFGTYWYSRGPDILLEVAKKTPNVLFCFVGDTNLQSIKIDPKDYEKYPNIRFDNKWVSDARARHWFRACDLVVLPYRRFYEHDSSGVFDQAMMAERPVVVPYFSPFKDIIHKYQVGELFEAEDTDSLQREISGFYGSVFAPNEFDKYLKQKGNWGVIGRNL